MFNWVCPRCGKDVPPSKTECPYCAPAAPEPPPAQQQPPQYQAPAWQPPPPQQAPPAPPQQYWQQPAQQYPPQQAPPQRQYGQPAPQQYWQAPPQYPPQQYPPAPPPQYQPQQYQAPPQEYPPPYQPAQQYQPEEQRPQQQAPPPPPPPPTQYAPAPLPQYTPPPAPARQPEASTPWPPPEQQAGRPAWQFGLLAFVGVLAIFGIAYYLMSSHRASTAKDAAKQQTTNPLQKYIEVVGIRLATDKSNAQVVKFLVVNHSGNEMTDLGANVTLWASTQRSEEDSVGSFTFHIPSLPPGDSKELTAPLKSDKAAYDQPDWQNITADVQVITAGQ